MSSGSERRNSLLRWGIAAFCTVILLAAILARNGYRNSSARWGSFLCNHAPKMWESMRAKGVRYPDLDHEDVANLFAYLYTARYVDEPGDATRGERLFATKGCARCHGRPATEAAIGPDLSTVKGVDTPIVWAQTMWNHAPKMEVRMQQLGVPWPKFEGSEMNDLLA